MQSVSFLVPAQKSAAAARKHGVELRRLVVAMGKLDPVNLDDENLNRVACSLPKVMPGKAREILTSFSAPGISAHSISSSLSAVQSLVDGMIVTCAKRRARLCWNSSLGIPSQQLFWPTLFSPRVRSCSAE